MWLKCVNEFGDEGSVIIHTIFSPNVNSKKAEIVFDDGKTRQIVVACQEGRARN